MNDTIRVPGTPPPELAPSQQASENVGFVRLIGFLGMMLALAGVAVIISNQAIGPRLIGVSGGAIGAVLGLVFCLYAALRESDTTVLRTYAFVGFGLIVLSGILTLSKPASFGLYGWPGLVIGLCFLICHARRETDGAFRNFTLLGMLAIGTVFTVVGLVVGSFQPLFIETYGIILTLVGVLYLAGYMGQIGSYTGAGYKVARLVGLLGLAAFGYGLVRSVLPAFTSSLLPYFIPHGAYLSLFGLLLMVIGFGSYSDRPFIVIARRELASYFYSPIAYIILMGMVVMGFFNYFGYLSIFTRYMTLPEPVVSFYLSRTEMAFLFLFIVPAITMKLLSEEKRTGSFEVLLGAPISELSVVIGKFLAVWIFYLILWIPFVAYLLPFKVEVGQPLDFRPILSFFMANAFIGAGFCAMGLFFSSLTKNQIIAAVLTFAGMLFFLLIVILPDTQRLPELLKGIFDRLKFWSTLGEAIQGRLYLRDLVVHGSIAVFWLYLSIKSVESRKWS
jgi:ABC-2 type transport system permease protein